MELKVFEDIKSRDVEKAFYGIEPYRLKPEFEGRKKRRCKLPEMEIKSVEQMKSELKSLFDPKTDTKKQESPSVPLSQPTLKDVTLAAKDIIENDRIVVINMEGQKNTFAVKDLSGNMYCTGKKEIGL